LLAVFVGFAMFSLLLYAPLLFQGALAIRRRRRVCW